MSKPGDRYYLIVQHSPSTWQYLEPPSTVYTTEEDLKHSQFFKQMLEYHTGKTLAIMRTTFHVFVRETDLGRGTVMGRVYES